MPDEVPSIIHDCFCDKDPKVVKISEIEESPHLKLFDPIHASTEQFGVSHFFIDFNFRIYSYPLTEQILLTNINNENNEAITICGEKSSVSRFNKENNTLPNKIEIVIKNKITGDIYNSRLGIYNQNFGKEIGTQVLRLKPSNELKQDKELLKRFNGPTAIDGKPLPLINWSKSGNDFTFSFIPSKTWDFGKTDFFKNNGISVETSNADNISELNTFTVNQDDNGCYFELNSNTLPRLIIPYVDRFIQIVDDQTPIVSDTSKIKDWDNIYKTFISRESRVFVTTKNFNNYYGPVLFNSYNASSQVASIIQKERNNNEKVSNEAANNFPEFGGADVGMGNPNQNSNSMWAVALPKSVTDEKGEFKLISGNSKNICELIKILETVEYYYNENIEEFNNLYEIYAHIKNIDNKILTYKDLKISNSEDIYKIPINYIKLEKTDDVPQNQQGIKINIDFNDNNDSEVDTGISEVSLLFPAKMEDIVLGQSYLSDENNPDSLLASIKNKFPNTDFGTIKETTLAIPPEKELIFEDEKLLNPDLDVRVGFEIVESNNEDAGSFGIKFSINCCSKLLKDNNNKKLIYRKLYNGIMSKRDNPLKYWTWDGENNKLINPKIISKLSSTNKEPTNKYYWYSDFSTNDQFKRTGWFGSYVQARSTDGLTLSDDPDAFIVLYRQYNITDPTAPIFRDEMIDFGENLKFLSPKDDDLENPFFDPKKIVLSNEENNLLSGLTGARRKAKIQELLKNKVGQIKINYGIYTKNGSVEFLSSIIEVTFPYVGPAGLSMSKSEFAASVANETKPQSAAEYLYYRSYEDTKAYKIYGKFARIIFYDNISALTFINEPGLQAQSIINSSTSTTYTGKNTGITIATPDKFKLTSKYLKDNFKINTIPCKQKVQEFINDLKNKRDTIINTYIRPLEDFRDNQFFSYSKDGSNLTVRVNKLHLECTTFATLLGDQGSTNDIKNRIRKIYGIREHTSKTILTNNKYESNNIQDIEYKILDNWPPKYEVFSKFYVGKTFDIELRPGLGGGIYYNNELLVVADTNVGYFLPSTEYGSVIFTEWDYRKAPLNIQNKLGPDGIEYIIEINKKTNKKYIKYIKHNISDTLQEEGIGQRELVKCLRPISLTSLIYIMYTYYDWEIIANTVEHFFQYYRQDFQKIKEANNSWINNSPNIDLSILDTYVLPPPKLKDGYSIKTINIIIQYYENLLYTKGATTDECGDGYLGSNGGRWQDYIGGEIIK